MVRIPELPTSTRTMAQWIILSIFPSPDQALRSKRANEEDVVGGEHSHGRGIAEVLLAETWISLAPGMLGPGLSRRPRRTLLLAVPAPGEHSRGG